MAGPDNYIPKCLSNDLFKANPLSINHIVFWDKTHHKIFIDKKINNKKGEVRFLCNKEGKIDIKKGNLKPQSSKLTMKFPKKVRLALAIAQVLKKWYN